MQEGNADAGRYQLETAISTYRNQTGLLGSDTVLAGYHLKLGRWGVPEAQGMPLPALTCKA